VSVSPDGAERIAAAERKRREFMGRVTQRLSTDDLATMIRGMQALADAVAQELD
jgi:hypothetical protein